MRILKNHLHIPPDPVKLALMHSGNFAVFPVDLSRSRGHETKQHSGQRTFSAARFAYHSQGFAPMYLKADAIDRVNGLSVVGGKIPGYVLCPQQDLALCRGLFRLVFIHLIPPYLCSAWLLKEP